MAVPVTSWTQAGSVLIRVAHRIVAPRVCLIDVTPTEDNNADLERVREFLSTMGVIGTAREAREEIDVDEVVEILQTIVAFPVETKEDLRPDKDLAYDLYKTVGNRDGELCPICDEPLVGTIVMAHCQAFDTPGAHLFHRRCLDPWLERSVTCPMCRGELWQRVYGPFGRLVRQRLWSIGGMTVRIGIHLAALCVPTLSVVIAGIIITADEPEAIHQYDKEILIFAFLVLLAVNDCMMELLWRSKQP